MKLRAGDWVEVRGKEEILGTLDKKGQLEGMPFMPQMFQYCGKKFEVYKRAHKTCDTVNPVRGMRVSDAVHLDLRCDGEAYGGCQANCLLFWKTAWLKLSDEAGTVEDEYYKHRPLLNIRSCGDQSCTEADVWAGTQKQGIRDPEDPVYVCQATQLPHFSTYLPWWDFRQYFEDYTSGNITIGQLLRGALYASYATLEQAGVGLGPSLRWLYNKFQFFWGGLPYPRNPGTLPIGHATPLSILNLQPGELVRVKSYEEILSTLDKNSKNRGLMFDGEMMPYCGGIYRVRDRIHRFIDEKTGKLSKTKQAAVILEGVTCQARYAWCRMFCPRSISPWWRETWLERGFETEQKASKAGSRSAS